MYISKREICCYSLLAVFTFIWIGRNDIGMAEHGNSLALCVEAAAEILIIQIVAL